MGFELVRALAPLGHVTAVDVAELDLRDIKKIRETVRDMSPSLIVNPAAYTDVDRAEEEPEPAREVNAVAPAVLAEEAKRLGIPLVHFSTDYVFDGKKKEPYTEDDLPHPINVYGQTKWQGEQGVQGSGAEFLILRLSWVYGMRGSNFLLTMLRLGKEKKEIRVVNDQFGAPTWCRAIAEATALIVYRYFVTGEWEGGVFHLPAGGQTSRFGFASRIFELGERYCGVPKPSLVPLGSAEYRTLASRPAFSVLTGRKLESRFGVKLPPWDELLNLALAGPC